MEGIEATPSSNMAAEGAIIGSERAAMLTEAIELVVEQIIDPLRKRSFAKKLMGSLVTDTKECTTILSRAADDIRSSFQVCPEARSKAQKIAFVIKNPLRETTFRLSFPF